MTENKKSTPRKSVGIASVDAPLGASGDAPLRDSTNASVRQFNGSQDAPIRESVNAPTNNSKGKSVSSTITAND